MVALSGFVLMLSFVAKESASARPVFPEERRLRLFHTHTGERIDIVYRRGDAYLDDALGRLDHFLRDHRTGQGLHYDPHLFDLLTDLTAAAGKPDAEIAVVCGYRSPWSNEFLRAHTAGVAKHSLHMRSEEHTSELQSRLHLVCRLLLEKKKKSYSTSTPHAPRC